MRPDSVQEAAALLRGLERPVRPVGGGTKPWLPDRGEEPLETGGLDRILEHNVGDFTAVLEAGVPFADAQAAFAENGQMIAWDPPSERSTLGGIMATADSGPLRHRFGGVRDLVVGVSVVLSDGTIAKAGGKVIKNVAGYDLAKLFAGSFGTLGLIATISVRLHPLPARTATVTGAADDPERLAAAVIALARLPLEADCLDVAWANGAGRVLVRYSGNTAAQRAQGTKIELDGVETIEDDDELWERQRSRQRAAVVLKVSGRPTDLPAVIRAADGVGASVVSRAGLGLSWLAFSADDPAERVQTVRSALSPRACTVLDGADRVGDPWPDAGGAQVVMERLKARFDPARIFRPGTFVGGI
ncbi:FAD-binding oxidoreductase [Candidatus Solirubrobacter pratensis]|uniref:FAD-binding oxidoreductase n=1 Tax=Candidatus Solirubrobacter pratensis TaxID=1298857 RepID=UPI00041C8966|nr:FAD-binding oxidoreductase [Candidatus Solirubrobacter pratensis]